MRKQTEQIKKLIDTWPESPIRYGTADCCQFAGWIVHQLTGADPLKGIDYNCQEQADAMIAKAGNLGKLVTELLGVDPVPCQYLQPGDPVLFSKFNVDAICSVYSPEQCVGLNREGQIRSFPLNYCAYGWPLCQE